jgi:predicted amidohydrolase YtcJ
MVKDMNICADKVIISNAIFKGTDDALIDGAIAIKGNKIIFVGGKKEVQNYIDSKTKIYEYNDKLVMPGFMDSHVHLIMGSLYNRCVNLGSARSEEEAAQMVKEFADSNPDDSWVLGFNWYNIFWEDKSMPTKKSLDKLIPDRPVFLLNAEAHGGWVNSKALEIAGIDRNTKDPDYGKIERDEQGEPTGVLYEQAQGLVVKYAYSLPEEKEMELLKSFSEKAIKLGVTSIIDVQPFFGANLGKKEVYEKYVKSDSKAIRLNIALGITEDNVKHAHELNKEWENIDKLKFVGFKDFIDGVPNTYTALLVEPYSDKEGYRGNSLIDLPKLKNLIEKAHKNDYSVKLHACGDGAVRFALDSYSDSIRKYCRKNLRHAIEHIEMITEEDIPKFKEYGIVASMQPEHIAITQAFADNPYPIRAGKEREKYLWAIRTIMETGAVVCFGSDYPVVDIDPFLGIYRAVTRVHNDGQPEGGWNPQEKLTIQEALRAYTYGSAYALNMEEKLGTLQEGKYADIVVLDKNLLNVSNDDILGTKIILTMINGEVVFEK